MKAKNVLPVVVILLILFSYFSLVTSKESKVSDDQTLTTDTVFRIGFLEIGRQRNFGFISKLNTNLWFKYDSLCQQNNKWVPIGWTEIGAPNDLLEDTSSQNRTDVIGVLDENLNHGYKTYAQRPKLEMLSFAQTSKYQCENINSDHSVYEWFYAFDSANHYSDITDSNHSVKFCSIDSSNHQPGFAVKNLRANREQTMIQIPNQLFMDANYSWYIKPRIRIDSVFAANPANSEKIVCNIMVYNFDGARIKNVDLKVRNFRVINNEYNGQYLENFKFLPQDSTLIIENGKDFNTGQEYGGECKMDIQIYWQKECSMWLDYIKVENDWAVDLLKGVYDSNWIKWEANDIATENTVYNFYVDESEYNMMPAIGYINQKIHTWKQNLSLNNVANINFRTPLLRSSGLADDSIPQQNIINKIDASGTNVIYTQIYPFYNSLFGYMTYLNIHQTIPNTLPNHDGYNSNLGILANDVLPTEYDDSNQVVLEKLLLPKLKTAYCVSQSLNLPLHFNEQIHLFYRNSDTDYGRKEPTNEEIDLQAYIALSYGAKAISFCQYTSSGEIYQGAPTYYRGMLGVGIDNVNPSDTVWRTENVYGQNKFESVCLLIEKVKKLSPHFLNFDIQYTKSYYYADGAQRSSLFSNSPFNDVVTFKPGSGESPCPDDSPDGLLPEGLTYDCKNERYLQIATFKVNTSDINKYFMVVNRRCSPFVDTTSEPNRGGKRNIRVRFVANHSDFSNFNNWNIINLYNDSSIATFDKRYSSYIDLDWFKPGEGRLYKIAPVMMTGGTLIGDEVIPAIALTCNDTVYNNGHNITIDIGSTITFSQSGKIEMNGGGFYCGNTNSNSPSIHVTLTGLQNWNGLSLNNCDTVLIQNTYFNNISDSNYAVDIVDCGNVYIDNNKFSLGDAGALRCQYINSEISQYESPVISYNIIKQKESEIPAVWFSAYDSKTIPIMINSNIISDTGEVNSSQGIYISGIYGAVISENSINNYDNGILLLASSSDIYDNTISTGSSNDESIGINAIMSDYVSTNVNSYYIGGRNTITNNGSQSVNLKFDNSIFNIDNGENTFNISSEQYAYHMYGWFPVDSQYSSNGANVTRNCFRINENPFDTATAYVSWGENGDEVEFKYDNSCETELLENYEVFAFGNHIRDTVYKKSGGQGGSVKENSKLNFEIQSGLKVLLDSITINSRKRNYSLVETRCKDFLNTFSDSVQAIAVLPKLYLACKATDSLGSKMNPLKTYLENLILNNNNNITLTTRAFYYIQKCKVALGLFQSAMQGFQQILTQFPYSY